MAHGRKVRPDEVGSDEVDRTRNGERGVEHCDQKDGSDEPRANRSRVRWETFREEEEVGLAATGKRSRAGGEGSVCIDARMGHEDVWMGIEIVGCTVSGGNSSSSTRFISQLHQHR